MLLKCLKFNNFRGCCPLTLCSEACLKVHMNTDRHDINLSRHRLETRLVAPDFFSREKTEKEDSDVEIVSASASTALCHSSVALPMEGKGLSLYGKVLKTARKVLKRCLKGPYFPCGQMCMNPEK